MVRTGDMRFGRGGLCLVRGGGMGTELSARRRGQELKEVEDGRGIYSLLDRLSVRWVVELATDAVVMVLLRASGGWWLEALEGRSSDVVPASQREGGRWRCWRCWRCLVGGSVDGPSKSVPVGHFPSVKARAPRLSYAVLAIQRAHPHHGTS